MKSPLHIFVPVDFKTRSVNAIVHSIELCKLVEAKLLICHIYNSPYFLLDPELGYDEDALIRIENYSTRRLAEQVDENFGELKKIVPELYEVPHEFIKETGNVVHSIVNAVEKYDVDLIVMGTCGLKGLGEFLGNKTSDVVDQAACPVLVLHEEVKKLNLDKIAIACDFKKLEDLTRLEILKKIVHAALSEVEIVHIAKSPEKVKSHYNREAIKLNWHIKSHKKSVQYCCHSNIEKGLMQYVNENEVGILALLPHEHSFLETLMNESLTHKMTFHAKVPLLALN